MTSGYPGTENANFRYSNDNRDSTPGEFDYPSQQEINPNAIKGARDYYPNDNRGYYPNSNRPDISIVDPVNKKQPPNSNRKVASATTLIFANAYSINLNDSNGYIDCGGNADFSFTDGAGNDSAFSISAWVKLDSVNKARVVAKGNVEWLFGTDYQNKFNIVLFGNDGLDDYISIRETASLTTGTWHHLVVTYDGSKTTAGVKLYRAGSIITDLTDKSVGTYSGMASQQGSLWIGKWAYNNSFANGLIDEVAVFDYELTSPQVSTIYNETNSNGSPADISSLNPLGWWRMGDTDTEGSSGSSTISNAASGTKSLGSSVNAVWQKGSSSNTSPTYSTQVPQ